MDMKKRRCAVCGKIKSTTEFGRGTFCPKTTCLGCKAKTIEFTESKTVMDVKRIIKGVK